MSRDGSVAVTGAGSGIGQAIAAAFAERATSCTSATSRRRGWPRPPRELEPLGAGARPRRST